MVLTVSWLCKTKAPYISLLIPDPPISIHILLQSLACINLFLSFFLRICFLWLSWLYTMTAPFSFQTCLPFLFVLRLSVVLGGHPCCWFHSCQTCLYNRSSLCSSHGSNKIIMHRVCPFLPVTVSKELSSWPWPRPATITRPHDHPLGPG